MLSGVLNPKSNLLKHLFSTRDSAKLNGNVTAGGFKVKTNKTGLRRTNRKKPDYAEKSAASVSLFFPSSWGPSIEGRKKSYKSHLTFESRIRVSSLVWPYRWTACMFWLIPVLGHCARGVIIGGFRFNSGHGIQLWSLLGVDIVNENRKLVSAVIWQMIRRMLGNMFDGGENIGYGATSEMIEWANNMVTYRHEQILDSGKEHYLVQVDGYNDPKLANGHFLLELLDAVCPGCVFWQAVKTWKLENGDINTQGLISNAQTVIRTMKQIGCILVFFDVEDIICVDEMWIVSMFGSILHRYRNGASDNMASAALAEKQQAERAALRIQAQWRKKKGTFAKHLQKTAQKFASMDGEWYYLNKQNETVGPFFTEEMRTYCSQGIITADMLVVESEGKWVAAETTSWFSNADTVKNRMNLFGGGHREAERPRLPTDRVGEIWIQTTDDDGDTYYYNEDNGETLWEFPSGQPSVRKYDEDGTTRFYDYDTNTFY